MCDCCKVKKWDFFFYNGEDTKIRKTILWKVYSDRRANLKLCRLCDIELFVKGEKRFFKDNIELLYRMSVEKDRFVA